MVVEGVAVVAFAGFAVVEVAIQGFLKSSRLARRTGRPVGLICSASFVAEAGFSGGGESVDTDPQAIGAEGQDALGDLGEEGGAFGGGRAGVGCCQVETDRCTSPRRGSTPEGYRVSVIHCGSGSVGVDQQCGALVIELSGGEPGLQGFHGWRSTGR